MQEIIEKIKCGEKLGAHKFRLFNANDKKKYIPKKTCQTDYKARKSKPWHDIYADESVDGVCNEFYRSLKTSPAK